MDYQDILKTLATLEQNLQNIDSSRRQVQNVISAYDSTRSQLELIVSDIQGISTELNKIFKAIGDNQNCISAELQSNVQEMFGQMGNSVTSLEKNMKNIQASFMSACDDVSRKISSEIYNSLSSLNQSVEGTIHQFSSKANEELDKITRLVQSFKDSATTMSSDLSQSMTKANADHHTSQMEIANTFQQDVSKHIIAFRSVKSELEKVLKDFENEHINLFSQFDSISNIMLEAAKEVNQNFANNSNGLKQQIDQIAKKTDLIKQAIKDQEVYHHGVDKEIKNRDNEIQKHLLSILDQVQAQHSTTNRLLVATLIIVLFSLITNIITLI